jgi:hypothetical protein
VEGAGDEFLAGAGFAGEQYGGGGGSDFAGGAVDVLHRRTVADQSIDQPRITICFTHCNFSFVMPKIRSTVAHEMGSLSAFCEGCFFVMLNFSWGVGNSGA